MDVTLLLEGDFIMVKKGDKFQTYSDKLKIQVVKNYLNGEGSQSAIAKKYKLRSRTQLMNWVRKYQKIGDISDLRGQKMVVITA
ncbi:transposase [Bacillus sp. TH22]|nr:transposase [Bacillus sp. TH45]MBK5360546.1 transposase [Bacillus sp. TH44]MBK5367444.1 transposase [Bacillus sp. TH50]MBK5452530.1 transposase [Bacillus sp. TH22]MBK5457864.1 transposase [Bacillus sp. TH23]